MSDQETGKKEIEKMDLHLFLDVYEWVTGEKLSELVCLESPDFICSRQDGVHVGIELTSCP